MEQARAPARPPAGGLLAVGTVLAIAVLVVSAVVVWARLAEGQGATASPTPDEGVPTELAGGYEPGDVPEAVAASRDGPVVGARLLDELPDGVNGCDPGGMEWEAEPVVDKALLTPEGLFLSFDGQTIDGQQWRMTCELSWGERGWTPGSSTVGPAQDALRGGLGSGFSCCDRDGLATATADAFVPEGAAWALQERGEWWLAYPVEDQPRLNLTWRFAPRFGGGRSVPTHVVFVDAQGQEISEEWFGH